MKAACRQASSIQGYVNVSSDPRTSRTARAGWASKRRIMVLHQTQGNSSIEVVYRLDRYACLGFQVGALSALAKVNMCIIF